VGGRHIVRPIGFFIQAFLSAPALCPTRLTIQPVSQQQNESYTWDRTLAYNIQLPNQIIIGATRAMSLFSRSAKRSRSEIPASTVSFPPVLKERAYDERYSKWIQNHRWNNRTEKWCLQQIEKFKDRPTVGILMECYNPREDFLRESLASIFQQIYPFHELSIVDRGSENSAIRKILEEVSADPRTKISFQRGEQRDVEAIAKIMKRASAEWILLMDAEDVLEPNALYNMVASLQNTVEIDFVFSDSDLLDEEGVRIDPQFKPVWAVGAHYPLGYYQHPVLLHDRLVKKLSGHEKISLLMLDGTLLDDASNHSRYVVQASGMLYHGRKRGRKNETPPEPVDNVLINENYVVEDGKILINTLLRARSEPKTPLRILWALDSLDQEDGPIAWFHLARYLAKESGHQFSVASLKDGPLRADYAKFTTNVQIVTEQDTISTENFDVVFVSCLEKAWFPQKLEHLQIPTLWQLSPAVTSDRSAIQNTFHYPATVLFLSPETANSYADVDTRKVSRVLPTGVDLVDLKTFKQRNSPFEWREKMGISNSAVVFSISGPTIPRKGQKAFVQAAIELLKRNVDIELQFLIAGERPGEYLNEIKTLIQSSGFEKNFHLIPETNDVFQYYPIYLISDVCVSCSTQEIFPQMLLEAMTMKKAVVALNVSGNSTVVEEEENGYLVEPGNEEQLADALDSLANKPELRDFFGRRSLEIIYEKFHYRKIATRFEDLLRETIVHE
jgi:glycosyltransferase involved in cell wall biosynthesis